MDGTMTSFAIKVTVPLILYIDYAVPIVRAPKSPADTRFYLAR